MRTGITNDRFMIPCRGNLHRPLIQAWPSPGLDYGTPKRAIIAKGIWERKGRIMKQEQKKKH